jgi:hypothetical protein
MSLPLSQAPSLRPGRELCYEPVQCRSALSPSYRFRDRPHTCTYNDQSVVTNVDIGGQVEKCKLHRGVTIYSWPHLFANHESIC